MILWRNRNSNAVLPLPAVDPDRGREGSTAFFPKQFSQDPEMMLLLSSNDNAIM